MLSFMATAERKRLGVTSLSYLTPALPSDPTSDLHSHVTHLNCRLNGGTARAAAPSSSNSSSARRCGNLRGTSVEAYRWEGIDGQEAQDPELELAWVYWASR